MKTQSKLILATALSFVLLSANTVMASENGHANANANDHHALPFSGGSENDKGVAVETYKNMEHHKLKFSGGSENNSGPNVATQADTNHHKEVIDIFSIDYMSNR